MFKPITIPARRIAHLRLACSAAVQNASKAHGKADVYLKYFRDLTRLYTARFINLVGLLAPRYIEVELTAPKIGLFAQLNWCIQLAAAARQHGRPIRFICTSSNYSPDGRDWLSRVLRQNVGEASRSPWLRIRLADLREFPFPNEPAFALSLPLAKEVFARTFSFTPDVLAGVQAVQAGWGDRSRIIGIHYRGTDKAGEAKRVPYEAMIDTIAELTLKLEQAGAKAPRYYVASDEAAFIETMRGKFGESRVLTNPRSERSLNETPTHLSPAATPHRAREAMIDALALAACPILVRTSSFLSGWAAILAENQCVVTLNEPFAKTTWFPECELTKVSFRPNQLDQLVAQHVRCTSAAARSDTHVGAGVPIVPVL